MNHSSMENMARLGKRWLAGILFGLLIIGACAAAFVALAAGLTSLTSLTTHRSILNVNATGTVAQSGSGSGSSPTSASYTWVSPNNPLTVPSGQNNIQRPTIYSNTNSNLNGAGQTTIQLSPTTTVTGAGDPSLTSDDPWGITHMHSPIGDAIDSGGVLLGDHVQHTFGSLLKGVLQTLFLEQNDNTSGGSTGQ